MKCKLKRATYSALVAKIGATDKLFWFEKKILNKSNEMQTQESYSAPVAKIVATEKLIWLEKQQQVKCKM